MAKFGLEVSEDGDNWTTLVPNGTSSSGTTLAPENVWEGEKKVRYLRYTGQGNEDNDWVSLTEFHFFGPVSPVELIPVVNVTANRQQEPDNVAGNTIDDDLNTRWSCENVSGQEECYIEFDLGSVRSVTRVDIAWYRGDKRMALFGLEASEDSNIWTTLVPNGTPSSGTTLAPENVWEGEQEARYLRYTGQGNTDNDWVSLTEFLVFGPVESR